jgi:hypothetical protein
MKPFLSLLLLIAFTMPACAAFQSATKSVDVPAGCYEHMVEAKALVEDAAPILLQGGDTDFVVARLEELVKGADLATIECAVDLYVVTQGGDSKLSKGKRLVVDKVRERLDAAK